MPDNTVSIIGLGWLGLLLAKKLRADGLTVKGSTTTADKAKALTQAGITATQLYLNPEPVGDLRTLLQADTLVINVPPKAGKFGDELHPQQMQALAKAIRPSTIQHTIYVSSTSVYPEMSREMIETDVVEPEQSAAPALVRAEQAIRTLEPLCLVTILRCGGLMGYNRIPGKYVAGKTIMSGAVPVNYLHRDDAVGIIAALIQHRIGGTLNAVAPEHPVRKAIYEKSCADFGFEQPLFKQPDVPVPYKVINAAKLRRDTGYQFKYPDPLQFFYQL